MRVRGLKQAYIDRVRNEGKVAPRAGAWIETALSSTVQNPGGRTPCGCVD
ncbi:conserved hypothetical protein [Syntrophaceticus schinkii]|uniref:Uncharacterized protein n=1 Tax=Syntrophaceticus schinkii TaxID=499207 RepID=A0A0B7MK18_9FIRM|nr:conserved hypothetical protein [Syntrophaceticus schinkii]